MLLIQTGNCYSPQVQGKSYWRYNLSVVEKIFGMFNKYDE